MADAFVYQPHVRDGSGVLTPDLLIDRLFYVCPPEREAHPLPIHLLSTATSLQQIGEAASASAALVLVAAGHGTIATVGSAHGRPRASGEPAAFGQLLTPKPVAREALRLHEIARDPSVWCLRSYRRLAGEWQMFGETFLTEIEGLSGRLARWSDGAAGAGQMLLVSANHREPAPGFATSYEVGLENTASGLRFAARYDVLRLERFDRLETRP